MPAPPPTRESTLALVRERIVAYAASRVGVDRSDAEELANDTLLLLHRKYPHLDAAADLVPLAVKTMKFKILELRRDKDRGHQPLGDSPLPGHHPNPETAAGSAQRESRILSAILQLGPRCRLLFLLKLQGFNFIEIMPRMAAASINTVYTWDRRCRAELQKLLGGAH